MEWKDKPEVVKGTYGENLVKEYFEGLGYIVYEAVTDKGHKFDFLCEKDGKALLIEVKTKAKMKAANWYGSTGIDTPKWDSYNNIKEQLNKPLYLFFVDHEDRTMKFGNFDLISEPIMHDDTDWPKTTYFNRVLFHPKQLTLARELTNEECHWLKVNSYSDFVPFN